LTNTETGGSLEELIRIIEEGAVLTHGPDFESHGKVSKMGIIYCITNIINEKKYVGQTVRTLEERWEAHVEFAYTERGRDSYFCRAIRKHGRELFALSILETVDDDKLSEAERRWIKELNTTDHALGYNSTEGGEGFSTGDLNPSRLNPRRGADSHSFGKPVPLEVRAKISKSLTGLLVGEKNPFFGKRHTEETKRHISEIQIGTVRGPHSDDTKDKIREKMLGRTFTPDWLDKMSQAKRGKKLTAEHRAKLSEAQKNRRSREKNAAVYQTEKSEAANA
jgi:group I intron endonuclease